MTHKLSRWLYSGLFLIAVVAVVYALFSAASGPSVQNQLERFATGDLANLDFSRAGEPAPEATFEGPDGTRVSLDAFAGKPILVNLWATWCAPCEREMPHLGALQNARGGDRFQVVAISVDGEDDKAYARKRLDELSGGQIDFYFSPPSDYEIVYSLGAQGFPTTILFDSDGREIARLSGEADWSKGVALALVDRIIERAQADTP